ncbi:MAG: AIR synthase-related protein [Candidatus Bathycorpusculaceae bacterium]
MGKLGLDELKKLLKCVKKDPRIIVPPTPGYDSGVHFIGDQWLVVSTDPCIGVPEEWFGWLLIHYAASDVALFGAKPEFCTINLLGSPSTKPLTFQKIMRQACKAAEELDMAIVTGHTGTYEGLSTLIGVCAAYGLVEKGKLITPGNAKSGDHILCTKPLGLEIAINLSLMNKGLAEKLFGARRTRELKGLVFMQSGVKEALALAEIKGVHAMHDLTEGGLTASLNEMADASKLGFKIEWEKIPMCEEAGKLKQAFRLSDNQLLSMSSTGTILVAVNPDAKEDVENVLRKSGLEPSFIGVFVNGAKRIILKNGKERIFPKKAEDPYERILSGAL